MWWKILQTIYTHESRFYFKRILADELGVKKEALSKYFGPLEDANLIKIEKGPLPSEEETKKRRGGEADYILHTGTGSRLYEILTKLGERDRNFLFDQVLEPLLVNFKTKSEGFDEAIEDIFLETGEIPSPEDVAQYSEISPHPRNSKEMTKIDKDLAHFKNTVKYFDELILKVVRDEKLHILGWEMTNAMEKEIKKLKKILLHPSHTKKKHFTNEVKNKRIIDTLIENYRQKYTLGWELRA